VTLTELGESRVNGYLFVLERALRTFLPGDVVRDAVREIESHVRERIARADGAPNERVAVEKILSELGPPLRVAQAYSAERTIDEAVTTGRVVPVLRAVWHLAVTTMGGFFAALLVVVGYLSGAGFLVIAALKPIFPDNVGFWGDDGWHGYPTSLGIRPLPPTGEVAHGGYWVIPIGIVLGLGILVLTHKCARRFLARWRDRPAQSFFPSDAGKVEI
jgi:hypothetical protein